MLREATDEIWAAAGLAVASAREGRLATSILRAATASSVSSTGQDYELPPMAVADTLDSVTWLNAAGDVAKPLQLIPLGLEATYSSPTASGTPTHFSLLDGVLRVYPRPNVTGSLRITYQRRHGQLVVGSDTASVVAATQIAPGSTFWDIQLSAVPASFVLESWVDVVGAYYPHRFKIHGARIALVASPTVRIQTDAPVSLWLVAGDTMTLYGKTPYVHLPLELRSWLTSRVAAKITGQLGDDARSARLDQTAERDAARARDALAPRTKVAREKAFNPRSLIRSGMRGRF